MMLDVPIIESAKKVCEVCLTFDQVGKMALLSEAMKFGYLMLAIGILIGWGMPKVGVWVRLHIMEKDKD